MYNSTMSDLFIANVFDKKASNLKENITEISFVTNKTTNIKLYINSKDDDIAKSELVEDLGAVSAGYPAAGGIPGGTAGPVPAAAAKGNGPVPLWRPRAGVLGRLWPGRTVRGRRGFGGSGLRPGIYGVPHHLFSGKGQLAV